MHRFSQQNGNLFRESQHGTVPSCETEQDHTDYCHDPRKIRPVRFTWIALGSRSSRCGQATALALFLLDIAARTKSEFSADDSIIVKPHKAQEPPKEPENGVQPIFTSILHC